MKHCYLTLILLLAATVTYAQNKATLIDTMLHRTNRLGLFKGNVMVVDKGKVIYKAPIGFTDASETQPLTTDYRFHIGSIAKEFNAVGIMLLKEEGKLDLDDKVSKYLPQLPNWAEKISIRNLLQYTSGLPDVNWKTVRGDADNMADLMKLTTLDFESGTHYAYNNNNVFLQRRIIEKISGMPFNKFVESKLLKPAGMSNSLVDPDDYTPLMAKSYDNNRKQGALIYPITGWTVVTLDDFYKWELALENFKLISPASTQILVTPFSPGKQCGLGGGTMQGNQLVFHKHDGISVQYQALLVGNKPKGRMVILMSNNKQNNIFDIDNAIEDILDGKPYVQPKKSILKDFQKQIDTLSGHQILALYHKLKQTNPDEYGFSNETTLNEIGYSLMNAKNIDAAITVFEYNTTLFPQSGNVFDSLGEAYLNKGDKAKALANYKRSLQLDPNNSTAKSVIEKLEVK
ncbi:serine hydrolase [Mucilaginibacter litoreus]|uniref:Serine hydrolase n=1 Tax=Mucilaginibacter litoreus TaxID=1048221 RepID=A0ABW3AVU9_9SPHI